MFTINTVIPTSARGAVRALVKSHPDWAAYLEEKGLISANARKEHLVEFASRYPALEASIEGVLGVAHLAGDNAIVDDDGSDDQMLDGGDDAAAAVAPSTTTAQATFDVEGLLSSVDQFLAPMVRSEIAKALGPVVAAANKGPVEVERIVEIERIVEVAAGEMPRTAPSPKARRDKKTTFRTLFPSRAKDIWRDAPLTLWTGAAAPAVDPFYVVDHFQMAVCMTAIERCANLWATGPAGTGKSTLPQQAAASLGRPFVKIGMTRQTEVEALVGGMGLINGATIWQDGALVKAMRQPGTVILIDELTFAPAGVQAIIQLVADDHRSLTLPTGEVVKAADGVVFIVADNTTGSGDEGGLYAGTNVSNAALVTRFKRMLTIDYLSPKAEAEALANHTACPLAAARHLADFVERARRNSALQGVVLSLRQMVGFVQCVQDGFSSKEAFAIAISSRMPATERATIEGMADLAWASTFDALIQNKPLPATPSNSAAANAFGDF